MNMPIIRSKDGTEIEFNKNGREMLKIYQKSQNEPNIFQDFEFMDRREDWLRSCIQGNNGIQQNFMYCNYNYHQNYNFYQMPYQTYHQPYYKQSPHYYQENNIKEN